MPARNGERRLTIFHTNDFHDRLTAARADSISVLLARTAEPKLLLDAGDAGGSSNVTYRASGEPALEEMTRLGYRAMTVGNRDFHVTRSGFRAKLFRAGFPVLCANVRPSRSGSAPTDAIERPLSGSPCAGEPDVASYMVADVGDWRALVIGLTVPMVTPRMWERRLSAYVFNPPIATAARLVPSLRAQFRPDICVALTHIGLRMDRELAGAVAGIDLIVGGHSHDLLPDGETVGDTLIVHAGSHGRYIGIVDVLRSDSPSVRPKLSARIETL